MCIRSRMVLTVGTAAILATASCAPTVVTSRAVVPQPILLSANDRVSPETKRQIEIVNRHLEEFAARYDGLRGILLPVP